MYEQAVGALKGVSPRLQVGGPASARPAWVGLLIDRCANTSTPLDFVSTHAYPDTRANVSAILAELRIARQ